MHGQIGVIRNQHIITSPNMPWVPDVQWQTSAVALCHDMRFGRDDYVLWPQWHHEKYPYLAAIPRPPRPGGASPYARMWYTPSVSDFVMAQGPAEDRRPGYVHKGFEEELADLRDGLLRDVQRILEWLSAAQDGTHKSSRLRTASTCLRHSWAILTSYGGTFDEKRLELAEFQRSWLELKGMVNYLEWEREATQHPGPTAQPIRLKDCIGCVVDNALIAMGLFEMGIPLWFVRDKMSVLQGEVYIQQATSRAMKPGDQDEAFSTTPDPTFPVIYQQSPRDLLHYHAQHQFSRIRAVIQRVSPAGQTISTDIPQSLIHRRDAATILVDLQTMRAQTSAGADGAASLFAPLAAVASNSSGPSASSALFRGRGSQRRGRQHPCKLLRFSQLHAT